MFKLWKQGPYISYPFIHWKLWCSKKTHGAALQRCIQAMFLTIQRCCDFFPHKMCCPPSPARALRGKFSATLKCYQSTYAGASRGPIRASQQAFCAKMGQFVQSECLGAGNHVSQQQRNRDYSKNAFTVEKSWLSIPLRIGKGGGGD